MSDQMLTYPTDKVVGVAADGGIVEAAHAALQASGGAEDRLEVYGGPNAPSPSEDEDADGVLASLVRTVRTTLGEEASRLKGLNEAIEQGRFVVEVELLDDDDEEAREAEKRAIGNALHDAGVEHVAFYGRLTVEELQIGA